MIEIKNDKDQRLAVFSVRHYMIYEETLYLPSVNINLSNTYNLFGKTPTAIKLLDRLKDKVLSLKVTFDESDLENRRHLAIEIQIFEEIKQLVTEFTNKLLERFNIHINVEDLSIYNKKLHL